MARIFYFTATGEIYGVHAGAFAGTLPAGIDFIDVAETPDQIVWPVNVFDRSGEHYALVLGGVLVPRDRALPLESNEVQALRELALLVGPAAVAKIDARFGSRP